MVRTLNLRFWVLFLLGFLLISNNSYAQSYNSENKELAAFLTRMYKSEPFEGVRVVTDYEHSYLLSVLTLDLSKYPTQSAANRVAGVKAMSEASRFFNGSTISSDLIIRMTERSDGSSDNEIIENIHEYSLGYIKQLQQLTNFPDGKGRQVFIYYKQLDEKGK
jgi:hypothetical protein